MKKKILTVALTLSMLACGMFAGVTAVHAEANPGVYDFKNMFEYTNAQGSYASTEGIIYNTAHYGANGFVIRSTKTGAEAEGSGAAFKGAFTGDLQFVLNAIPKEGADGAEDYAFRKLTVRFTDVLDEDEYFDYVIHNYHSWVADPSVYPNVATPTAQGALSFVEYKGIEKSTSGEYGTSALPENTYLFGGVMEGSFCGPTAVTSNMVFEYRADEKEIWAQDGSATGAMITKLDYDHFGDAATFDAQYYTVEFIFEDVEDGQTPGIAIAIINSETYGEMWTNTEGSKQDAQKPLILSDDTLLGDLGTVVAGGTVNIPTDVNILAVDFETGKYDLPLNDAKVSLSYRRSGESQATPVSGVSFAAPAEGEYEILAAVTDTNGTAGDAVVIGSFEVGADKTPPVVTLKGDGTIYTEVGTPVADPGATATDAIDGECVIVSDFEDAVDFETVGSYVVRYTAEDKSGNEGYTVRTVVVQDTTAPSVTLKGSAQVSVEIGGTYTEAGVSVSDNYTAAEDIEVTTEGTVNTAVAGTYKIKYTAKDGAGNSASAERTVTVADNTAPSIKFENAVTTGIPGEGVAIAQITVTDNSGETILPTVSVTDADGAPVEVADNQFVPEKEGEYTVTATAVDSSGNTHSESYTVTVAEPGGCSGSVSGAGMIAAGGALLLACGALLFKKARR